MNLPPDVLALAEQTAALPPQKRKAVLADWAMAVRKAKISGPTNARRSFWYSLRDKEETR